MINSEKFLRYREGAGLEVGRREVNRKSIHLIKYSHLNFTSLSFIPNNQIFLYYNFLLILLILFLFLFLLILIILLLFLLILILFLII